MVLPWDRQAVDATTQVKKYLEEVGSPIGANDTAIAEHAIAADCVLVSNSTIYISAMNLSLIVTLDDF